MIHIKGTLQEFIKLNKLMKKLDKKYDKAEGKPTTQARIMKKAMCIQEKLDVYNKREEHNHDHDHDHENNTTAE